MYIVYFWLVVWNICHFSIHWEWHHPNWLSYFSEGWFNHQADFVLNGEQHLIFSITTYIWSRWEDGHSTSRQATWEEHSTSHQWRSPKLPIWMIRTYRELYQLKKWTVPNYMMLIHHGCGGSTHPKRSYTMSCFVGVQHTVRSIAGWWDRSHQQ